MAIGITSAPSPTATATLTLTNFWLKDPTNAALDLIVYPTIMDYAEKEAQQVVFPLGATTAVVIRSELTGATLPLKFQTTTDPQYTGIKALRDTQHTLLYQTDMGQQWYVALGGEMKVSVVNSQRRTTTPARTVEIEAVEVSTP